MEDPEPDRTAGPEEGGSLNRNRSFKSKQLVRSQAIRESQSPPRAATPTENADAAAGPAAGAGAPAAVPEEDREEKRRPVEIQITSGSWEGSAQRARRRWPPQRDLLSNAPRVACVAGCRHSGQHCRGPRRRQTCPTKQDSGISCPDDCTDCSDFDHTGGSSNDVRKACSLDDDSYCRCPDRRDMKLKNNSLNRADSADFDKVEPSGPELVQFIKDTLNKNARDRLTLLKIEKELHALVTDTGRCIVKFPVMTSYGRMLVHRVAALFQLSHHLDTASKNSVTVSKSGTSGGRIPCTSFNQWCTASFPPSPVRQQDGGSAKSILKRDTHSPDDSGSNCRAVERSKSLEQREKDYERVRRRIFSEQDNCCQDESQWPWLSAGPVKLLTPDTGRNKLLKVQSLESSSGPAQAQSWRSRGAVAKSHSFGGYGAGAEPPPQRLLSRQGTAGATAGAAAESHSFGGYGAGAEPPPQRLLSRQGTAGATAGAAAESHSFGGYGAGAEPPPQRLLSRQGTAGATAGAAAESHSFGGYGAGAEPPPQRLLSRQGDLASSSWRLSPSSSGYKTLSLRSTDSVTPSPTGGASPEPTPEGAVVWAVTDLSAVPPGALVIHPQTGRPLTNADGSVYHFDPANPPVIYDASAYIQDQKIQNCEKRRGRLEKQHSFIDAEAECRCDDGRSKCCCECRRHDSCAHGPAGEKLANQPEQTSIPVPPSPVKNRYEQNAEQSTNEIVPAEPVSNQHPFCDAPANQIAVVEPPAQRTEIATNQGQAFEPATNQTFEPVNQRQYESPVHQQRFENRTFVASPHQRPPSFDPANQRPPSFDSANQRPPSFDPASQRPPSFETTNQRQTSFDPANQRPPSFDPANQRPPSFDPANQRPPSFDSANQRPPSYDSANQRAANENIANQMQATNKLVSQESVEAQYVQHAYSKGYRNDEVTSPPQLMHNQVLAPDVTGMYSIMAAGKVAPLPAPDPNLRPVSLTNMIFPGAIAPGYPYVNQVRMEQPLHPVYQPVMAEEPKLAPSPHTNDSTFRIDPSYPYPLQYGAACGQCAGIEQPQHRGYNLGYGQLEQPVLQQPYQVGNVLLQHNVQHYPYQEAMQWGAPSPLAGPGKLLLHELCPGYAQYPYLYPQMIPQPYPIMQPVYPVLDKRPKRGSGPGSQRAAPLAAPERRDSDIAAKIQQIKEQMSHLNTQDKERPGNGLLGNAPMGTYNGRMGFDSRRPVNDETQLTSAARAIVNSIRNMQANTYHHEFRRQQSEAGGYRERDRRRDDRDDKRRPPLPRQVTELSPGNWYRRSPGPMHPVLNHPRRPHPDTRNPRR